MRERGESEEGGHDGKHGERPDFILEAMVDPWAIRLVKVIGITERGYFA
jgi:hypothetical protein